MSDEEEVAMKSVFGIGNNLIEVVGNIEQRLNVANERLTELEDTMNDLKDEDG